jgi:putative membrane protein
MTETSDSADDGHPAPAASPDTDPEHGHAIAESEAMPLPALLVRSGVGGVLMGLANLVPGISGGTMLLAAGVYPTFISSIAELTTLRVRPRPVLALAAIGGAAAVAILLLAGTMRGLVVDQRWIMYSLFIGLTLGGVPLVWRLARPATPGVFVGGVVAFGLMAAMALTGETVRDGDGNAILLGLAGLAGASAMILPGVSGGYLLLLLGQYEPILGAIDGLKEGLLGEGGASMALVQSSLVVLVPVGIGVAVGIVGVSNLVRWLLDRFEKPTLGALLGLLLGSVVGLYPFQEPVAPQAGHVHRGQVLTADEVALLAPKYWPLERFTPGAGQAAGAIALVLAGFAATWLVDRIGGEPDAG